MEDELDDRVYYCGTCLSFGIVEDEDGVCYCKDCGSTDVRESDLASWDSKYFRRYGYHYVNKPKDV